jgi:archaemetzincin
MCTLNRFLFLLFLTLTLAAGCQPTSTSEAIINDESKVDGTLIKILPLGAVDAIYIDEAVAALKKYTGNAVLLKARGLPPHAYYLPRNRYRADSLIKWMAAKAGPGEVYVGLTSVDISTTKDGNADFGVMGLGYQPGRACVISSFRLKNKRNFYKLVLHEAAHTAGLPHCPEATCFLRDAKGGDHTEEEIGFCNSCSNLLKAKGWVL